ncbi:PEP-CTERM sorting domain-containing protein [Luteolibacter sp. Populi]|uniref:PEP-CTERM sorting domain-containing protein n=1 Tax=Luteolibacter sp. Populi TaxID=3230487 RepID=UPI003467BA33
MHNTIVQHPILTFGISLFTAISAQAATVLVVDISNPAAVTFTSTPNFSQTNSSLNIGTAGFTIRNFLASPASIPSSTLGLGNLSPTGSTFVYSGMATFSYEANDGNFTSANDLSVFSNGGGPGAASQVFSTGTRAFNGVLTIDLSAYVSSLPAAGVTGDVISGYFLSGTADHGETVGQFVVIPEPGSVLLGGLGFLILGFRRRSIR